MKKFGLLLIALILLPCIGLVGCALLPKYVTGIEETANNVYTVTYSDGSTSTIKTDGKDGQNGADLTIENIKKYCEDNDLDFYEFLSKYFGIESTIESATTKSLKSAVSIWCEHPTNSSLDKDTSVSCGAGVIYKMNDEYSYIITNYHVVYYTNSQTSNKIASKITLFQYGTSQEAIKTSDTNSNGYPFVSYGKGAIDCEYIGGSMNYDLAVLRVPTARLLAVNSEARAVDIANKYHIADTAIAIGNPECEGLSVTSGIVSVVSEDIEMKGADEKTTCQFRVMRIDTAINGGNSGGGLFNDQGELIGIVNAKLVDDEIDNIAYALPVDNITKVADNLIHYFETTNEISKVKKVYLDIYYAPDNSKAIYEGDEVYITDEFKVATVTEGGLGESLGIKKGDVLRSATITSNGTTSTHIATRAYEMNELLLTVRAGDQISFSIDRGGNIINTETHTVTADDFSTIK